MVIMEYIFHKASNLRKPYDQNIFFSTIFPFDHWHVLRKCAQITFTVCAEYFFECEEKNAADAGIGEAF